MDWKDKRLWIGIIVVILFVLLIINYSQEPHSRPSIKYLFSCNVDSDCICCDGVYIDEEPYRGEICVNKDYFRVFDVECLQIESPYAFCARRICKCVMNECVAVLE